MTRALGYLKAHLRRVFGQSVAGMLLICSTANATEPSAFRPVQDWPLGECRALFAGDQLCLDAQTIWTRFGHGAPEIEVAVVETWETRAMAQQLAQHPWLSHLDIPSFWHVQKDADLPIVDPKVLPTAVSISIRQRKHVAYCRTFPDDAGCEGVSREEDPEVRSALSYRGWAGRVGHEIQMIGLISGQDIGSMRRTGLAPLSAVSLHYLETTPSSGGLSSLARRLDRRSGVRVVNFSNEGPREEPLDLQYARIYRTALALNAGRAHRSGQAPDDRLLVASSANTVGTLLLRRSLPAPNRLLPPELIYRQATRTDRTKRLDPVIAHVLPRPDVPVLVVGSITDRGQLFGRTRVEPMIDLYAPGGVTDLQSQQRLPGADSVSRAMLRYDAIRKVQACAFPDPRIEAEGVPTLDWGPKTDVRSAQFVLDAEENWARSDFTGAPATVSCRTQEPDRYGVFLARAIGNSVSTALVSAVAAQMFALDPALSARDARQILVETARANRVNGLPVLDAVGALERTRDGYLQRYLDTSLAPRSERGDAAGPPILSAAQVLPDPATLTLVPATVTSRSIAPGLFGQAAWRSISDDPLLELTFRAEARQPGRCQVYAVTLITETVRHKNQPLRRIRNERIRLTADDCQISPERS